MKRIRNVLLVALLLAAVAAGEYVFLHSRMDKPESFSVTVEHKLKAIQELATYTYMYSDFVEKNDTRSLAGIEMPGTKNTIIVMYNGIIKFGFDMADIKYDYNEPEKTLALKLPEVKVIDNYVDTESIKTYEINNIFNPINVQDFVDELQQENARHLEEARAEGAFELAEKHAEEVLITVFSTFDDMTVVFE